MNAKENLINEVLLKLVEQDLSIQTVKETLEMVLYDYSVSEIKSTELSVSDGSVTRDLLTYFRVGKLGANKGTNSIAQYELVVHQLCDFVHKELNMITSDDIKYFLAAYRKINGVSSTTMDNKRLCLSSVFTYLYTNGKINKNPMDKIEKVKVEKRLKLPLNDLEIEKIMDACESYREYAMISLLLTSGIRAEELCNLKFGNFNFDENSVIVFGKGRKERICYFSEDTKTNLQLYFMERKDEMTESTPVFIPERGKTTNISVDTVERVVKKIGKESGVKRLHPHLLRATYATKLARNGVPASAIAKLLGHENLNTINRYVIMADDDVKKYFKDVKHSA